MKDYKSLLTNSIKIDGSNVQVHDTTKEEPKQETTLEEAFEKWSKTKGGYDKYDVLIFGAKWQQEESKQTDENGNPLTYWGGLTDRQETFDDFDGDVNSLNLKKSEMEKLHNKIINGFQEEPKQETLEEALLEDIKFLLLAKSDTLAIRLIEKYGHNKQQERSYSEEEVYKMINDFAFDWNYNYRGELNTKEYLVEWFEKFKKKIRL
jgi:hypothetical protein